MSASSSTSSCAPNSHLGFTPSRPPLPSLRPPSMGRSVLRNHSVLVDTSEVTEESVQSRCCERLSLLTLQTSLSRSHSVLHQISSSNLPHSGTRTNSNNGLAVSADTPPTITRLNDITVTLDSSNVASHIDDSHEISLIDPRSGIDSSVMIQGAMRRVEDALDVIHGGVDDVANGAGDDLEELLRMAADNLRISLQSMQAVQNLSR